MPHFSNRIKTYHFQRGPRIPQSASHAVKGSSHGTYFFWRGAWMFTVIDGFYIETEFKTLDSINPLNHAGHAIEKLK